MIGGQLQHLSDSQAEPGNGLLGMARRPVKRGNNGGHRLTGRVTPKEQAENRGTFLGFAISTQAP